MSSINWKVLALSLVLAFLMAYPPFAQTLHQVFSHHDHLECCDHHDEGKVQHEEEECGIVSFEFYQQVVTQSTFNQGPGLTNAILLSFPLEIQYINQYRISLPARAPPIL